ncbi:MAG: DNA polymerase III subunit delta [Gammaproteobacteria bacterium]|nr:DNA polymerase III subunit delta [Gammaproteobacteria bacterium]
MQISTDQLVPHLKRGLAPIYFVYGEETLLVDECCRSIRDAAQAAGYQDRQVFTVESGFDWNDLYACMQSLSLFAEKRLIELRLPTGKPGESGAKILIEIAAQAARDIVFMVSSGKLDKQVRESKWAKALETAGNVIAIYPLEAAQWPLWIRRRMEAKGLKPGPGVVDLLAHLMEGNMLACAQEIDKLVMLFGSGEVSLDDIEGNLGDNARFNVFALADASLRGEAATVDRILGRLRGEGVEPVLILWALAREIRELTQMATLIAAGQAPMRVLEMRRVWAKRKPLVTAALKRLSRDAWQDLLSRCARADRILKGRGAGDIWQELQCLALGMSGVKLHT